VQPEDFDDFQPASGPVHLQRLVEGADARIHVIGGEMVAQRVMAASVDYRRSGGLSEMEEFEPSAEMRKLLVEATKALGLAFAGWDFKIGEDEVYWCFEANPMPGYGPYDNRCDGAITTKLLRFLGATQI
jgi:glutathione synthase/RimK-type ligase-like ATP-grasp enzyme